jgi:hypothetical protein
MTSRDSKAWRELYGVLCATHDRAFDEAQSKFYFDGLKDLDLVDVKAAALELAQSSKWFPKLAEWRHAIGVKRFNERRERERVLANRKLSQTIHCERCRDTTMRPSDNDPTRYTHCECRDTNPNYQISRAREALQDDSTTGPTPTIPAGEAQQLLGTVRDFKRLSGADE